MHVVQAGLARKEITAWESRMQLWGWFMPENRATGAATPLFARALVVRDPSHNSAIAYVCTDLGFVSLALRRAVLGILRTQYPARGFGPHNVMLTATHTHSGPNGYADVVGQNSTTRGFSPPVFRVIAQGILTAILEADDRCEDAILRVGTAHIPHRVPIAFNRSMAAFRRNPDVSSASKRDNTHATHRVTTTLRIDDTQDRTFGMVNWFGVHATNIHAENTLLHSDNKGLAALLSEQTLPQQTLPSTRFRDDLVAIFAQEAAGDVSPNFRYHPKRKKVIGAYENDEDSAQFHAQLQHDYALKALQNAAQSPPLVGPIGGITRHVDMASVQLDPCATQTQAQRQTGPATWGIQMPTGTAEGPGPLYPAMPLLRSWMRLRRLQTRISGSPHDPKIPFLQLGLGTHGRFLGVIPVDRGLPYIGAVPSPIQYIHRVHRTHDLHDEPWLPQILPLQLLRIGSLLIAGLPAEPTTTSGQRLRNTLYHALAQQHTHHVIINGYTNGYAGYVTTPQEYQEQAYEGAYTLFGPWTLDAYRQIFHQLARSPLPHPDQHNPLGPPLRKVTYEMLVERRYTGRNKPQPEPTPDAFEETLRHALR